MGLCSLHGKRLEFTKRELMDKSYFFWKKTFKNYILGSRIGEKDLSFQQLGRHHKRCAVANTESEKPFR